MIPKASSLTRLLKFIFIILFIVVIVVNLVVNTFFNMTGYTGKYQLPGSDVIASVAERIKQHQSQGSTSSFSMLGNRTLMYSSDYEKLFVSKSQSTPLPQSRNISVLFYNPPDWMNVNSINEVFSRRCVYNNCVLKDNTSNVHNEDAIIFSPHEPMSHEPPIEASKRRGNQVWIMFGVEAPVNFAYMGYRHQNWQGTINWTMSYRMNADIFYPYALLKPKASPTDRNYREIYHGKYKFAGWVVSHCNAESLRDEYVKEMLDHGAQVSI